MEGNIYANWHTKERLLMKTRVAATPKTVEQLLKLGFSVAIESGRVNWQVLTTKRLRRLARIL